MAIRVQDDEGSVADANAYVSLEEFKAYCAERGRDLASHDDAACEVAIVRATDYADARFEYVGRKRHRDQATAWPRQYAYDGDGWRVVGVPATLKKAVHEYAHAALTGELMPNPTRDETGQVVVEVSSKLGPIEDSVKYGNEGMLAQPRFPLADSIIRRAGLARSGKTLARA